MRQWVKWSEAAKRLGIPGDRLDWKYIHQEFRVDGESWVIVAEPDEDEESDSSSEIDEWSSVISDRSSASGKGSAGAGGASEKRRMIAVPGAGEMGPTGEVPDDERCYPPVIPEWLRVDEDGTRWVTVKRAAETLGWPESRVRYRMRADRLVHVKEGGRVWALEYALQYIPRGESRTNKRRSPAVREPQDDLITAKAAAEILGVSEVRVGELALEGKLTRVERPVLVTSDRFPMPHGGIRRVWVRWWYRIDEVEELAEERAERRRSRHDPFRSLMWWGDRSTFKERLKELMPEIPLENARGGVLPDGSKQVYRWITSAEAARILGVSVPRVRRMVDLGSLPAYQKHPGKAGSRLWIYSQHVYSLMRRPEYQKKRAAALKGIQAFAASGPQELKLGWNPRAVSRFAPAWASPRFPYMEIPGVDRRGRPTKERDYGEYYTTRQVALLLKVGVTRVLEMRRTGRLQGYQRPLTYQRHPVFGRISGRGPKWWFFKKSDVDALQADHEYVKRRRGYDRSVAGKV